MFFVYRIYIVYRIEMFVYSISCLTSMALPSLHACLLWGVSVHAAKQKNCCFYRHAFSTTFGKGDLFCIAWALMQEESWRDLVKYTICRPRVIWNTLLFCWCGAELVDTKGAGPVALMEFSLAPATQSLSPLPSILLSSAWGRARQKWCEPNQLHIGFI